MDEGPLGVHEVEFVVETRPRVVDRCGVAEHADGTGERRQVTAWEKNKNSDVMICVTATWNGHAFRVTGLLWGESTGNRSQLRSFEFFVDVAVEVNTLRHWDRDKMAAIFKKTFSNAFQMYEFLFWFHWNLFLGSNLQYSSIGSDHGLAPIRRQGIVWTKND